MISSSACIKCQRQTAANNNSRNRIYFHDSLSRIWNNFNTKCGCLKKEYVSRLWSQFINNACVKFVPRFIAYMIKTKYGSQVMIITFRFGFTSGFKYKSSPVSGLTGVHVASWAGLCKQKPLGFQHILHSEDRKQKTFHLLQVKRLFLGLLNHSFPDCYRPVPCFCRISWSCKNFWKVSQ